MLYSYCHFTNNLEFYLLSNLNEYQCLYQLSFSMKKIKVFSLSEIWSYKLLIFYFDNFFYSSKYFSNVSDYLTKSRHCAGGSRIEKIRKDCKADITINQGKDNRRIVIITGTLQQIETVKIILKNTLQFFQKSRNDPCNMKINFKNWKFPCQTISLK